ncbi:hypothetical protein TNCV_3342601 [Trichonephila clavipes]|nr:hypothetical protein TNCV_3342601 [Trichonephila clavipes]
MRSENVCVWEIVIPDDPDQDNVSKLLNYCIVIGPGQNAEEKTLPSPSNDQENEGENFSSGKLTRIIRSRKTATDCSGTFSASADPERKTGQSQAAVAHRSLAALPLVDWIHFGGGRKATVALPPHGSGEGMAFSEEKKRIFEGIGRGEKIIFIKFGFTLVGIIFVIND